MILCIAGMPRSGTSLVTQLLHRAGLDLGERQDLMPASENNTDGYWENLRFVHINDRLLTASGGTWFAPPSSLRPTPRLDADARSLVAAFEGREPWGWKDPRNALTLPFWKTLLPSMKVLVCLRHPAESAASLAASTLVPPTARFYWSVARPDSPLRLSNGKSAALPLPRRLLGALRAATAGNRSRLVSEVSLDLWRIYQNRILAATAPHERLVTHYSAMLADPRTQLERILAFAGLRVPADALDAISGVAAQRLRHQRAETTPLAGDFAALYDQLCAEAGYDRSRVA